MAQPAPGDQRPPPAREHISDPVRPAVVKAYLAYLRGGALAEEPPRRLTDVRDRRLFVQMLRGMVRHQRLLESELARLGRRPGARASAEPAAVALLGLFQLLFMDGMPPHAAVHETVALAVRLGHPHTKGWVNAILRREQREMAAEPGRIAGLPLALRTSHPDWLVERWRARYGEEETARLCDANNLGGGATIRVETGRADPAALRARLAEEGVAATPHPLLPSALWVEQLGALLAAPAFREGLCYVQDVASQVVMAWAAPVLKGWVADGCAAPGGKLSLLAGLRHPARRLVGLDVTTARLRLIGENARRLRHPPVPLLRADGRALPFRPGGLDALVLDVPCSATGMIRKYPELKWRKRPEDIPRHAATQLALLLEGAAAVRPGGRLLYITCSLEPEENEGAVAELLAARPEWERTTFHSLAPPRGLRANTEDLVTRAGDFQMLPAADRMGLYAALLRRKEA